MANISRLRAALDFAEAHPEQHRQQAWRAETKCGTTMCLAGHGASLFGAEHGMTGWGDPIPVQGEVLFGSVIAHGEEIDIEEFAATIYELDRTQAYALFFNMGGVDDLRKVVDEIEAGLIGDEPYVDTEGDS